MKFVPLKPVVALVLLLLLVGCRITWVKRFDMTVRVLNDANNLLCVEGRTDLPPGAPLEAILLDRQGQRLARSHGEVTPKGTFYLVLDIRRVPGFTPLHLEVVYDPLAAPATVAEVTGPRGEAMSGPLVVARNDRRLLATQRKFMLEMENRQAALRHLDRGEEGLRELESFVARYPRDGEAILGLGLGYLKHRRSERHPGSQAHGLLARGLAVGTDNQDLELQARLWLARLDAEARARQAERERLAQREGNPGLRTITPGRSIGPLRLGMKLRILIRYHTLDHHTVSGDGPIDTFQLKDMPGTEVSIDKASDGAVSILTRQDVFRLQDGIGPGSLVPEAEEILGERLSVRFEGPQEQLPDGQVLRRGTVVREGLIFHIERRLTPSFPLPVDIIVGIEVVPFAAPEETARPGLQFTPAPDLTPADSATPEQSPTPATATP